MHATVKRFWPMAAVGVGFVLGVSTSGLFLSSAMAQTRTTPGGNPAGETTGEPVTSPPFNATEQRNRVISQLDQMNHRLATIEAKLDKGLSVKVTEMPAVIVKENNTEK